MLFENLSVGRIVLHEVFQRRDDKQPVPPRYGVRVHPLDGEALETFTHRILSALGSKSRSVEMAILQTGAGSTFEISRSLMNDADTEFARNSQRFADKLAAAQTSRNLPGGVLVVFDGTVGSPPRRMLGIVKAEPHAGFTRRLVGSDMELDSPALILTPEAKLYKIGVFVERRASRTSTSRLSAGWQAFVFDHQMVAADRAGAAQYFYETFLGCTFQVNNAFLTRKFYDLSKSFIRSLPIAEGDKTDLYTALYTYLKVERGRTVEVKDFSSRFLAPDRRDAYEEFMRRYRFPLRAVPKDLSDLGRALRQRRVIFTSDIRITGPSERFGELVQMEPIQGTPDAQGVAPEWTRVTIRDHIRSQE